MTLSETIRAYHGDIGEHHRYRSWEHCYTYFRTAGRDGLSADGHKAALHLAFYLASWGMYRGSTFLLQYAYTVHLELVELLSSDRFDELWHVDFGEIPSDRDVIPLVMDLVDGIRAVYAPFAQRNGSGSDSNSQTVK